MSDHAIALWTFAFTAAGVIIAAVGILYAIRTLQAGAESIRLATEATRANTEIARAQFWVMVRGVLANYDDVHAKLRPEGMWAPRHGDGELYAWTGPETAAEWARVELYMGLFEYCETLLKRGLLEEKDFEKAYRYRLGNLVDNGVIVERKLVDLKDSWLDFWDLCHRFRVPIPSRSDLSESPRSRDG